MASDTPHQQDWRTLLLERGYKEDTDKAIFDALAKQRLSPIMLTKAYTVSTEWDSWLSEAGIERKDDRGVIILALKALTGPPLGIHDFDSAPPSQDALRPNPGPIYLIDERGSETGLVKKVLLLLAVPSAGGAILTCIDAWRKNVLFSGSVPGAVASVGTVSILTYGYFKHHDHFNTFAKKRQSQVVTSKKGKKLIV
eukprot:Phypoly_transcript_14931.p1 GENE.Phypoly_transcript_14931~~Phypoly_transcript_14931.p1  ORF type:complete len:197 (+),score=25.04 Phypoly_transcript_14931:344-934(+)